MDINTKLLCKKQMSEDTDGHGLDFIVGNVYSIPYMGIGEIDIITEDGSIIWFESESDVLKYFEIIP